MTAITHAISAALLHFVWQGLLIALLMWIALAILRNGSARHRYFVSCAAFDPITRVYGVGRVSSARGGRHAPLGG